ncbi:hypothetical protein M0802_007651 [Mischocyttarus mexicanus]|nr:hypothetical protein M0802_007651 [Mischocyttarus mexicanus]
MMIGSRDDDDFIVELDKDVVVDGSGSGGGGSDETTRTTTGRHGVATRSRQHRVVLSWPPECRPVAFLSLTLSFSTKTIERETPTPLRMYIDEDLKEENVKQLLNQEIDLDKTGGGQHYCIHCSKYFINKTALHSHFTTKVHKRRLKALEIEPYTIEDSERAAGKGSYIEPQKRIIETLTVDNETGTIAKAKLVKMDI